MKTGTFNILLGMLLLAAVPAKAVSLADYENAFEVDLNAKLPTYAELEDFTLNQESDYDTKYTSIWDLGTVFDRVFYTRIATYGSTEKRMKGEMEDEIIEMLNSIPKEMYQYIGPMIHEIPNMSDKILNLPGIKETKNKFPTRIAEQLKDVKDLEFLSPFLYPVLMPEAWPSNERAIEFPQRIPSHPKVVYNPKFYEAIKALVPPSAYMSNAKNPKRVTRSDLRTINPSKDSLLTSKDVQAFINTIDKVQEFGNQPGRMLELSKVAVLLNNYEMLQEDNKLPVNSLRDVVNPCQRLVQKIKILGWEKEFALVVAGDAFTIEEWAYTCEKTLKAYRLSNISSSLLLAIKGYQNGYGEAAIDKLSPRSQAVRYSTMQSILQMYNAPLNDVLEVRKNRAALKEKFLKYDNKLLIMPVSRMD